MKRRFKNLPPADDAGNPGLPQAILTLTADEKNPNGFTIGMALASHAEGDEMGQMHAVDVVLLALVNTLKKVGPEFKAELDLVNSSLMKLSRDLNQEDADPDAAIAAFSNAVGVQADVEPANDAG